MGSVLPARGRHWIAALPIAAALLMMGYMGRSFVEGAARQAVEDRLPPPPITSPKASQRVETMAERGRARFHADLDVTETASRCETLIFSRSFRPEGGIEPERAEPLAVAKGGAGGVFPANPFRTPGHYPDLWTEYAIRYGERGTYLVYGTAAGCSDDYFGTWLLLAIEYDWTQVRR